MDDANFFGEAQEAIHMGLMYTQQGKYERAVSCFDSAIMLLPEGEERIKVYSRRANLHRHLGNVKQAIDDYTYVINHSSEILVRADSYNHRGDLYSEEHRYQMAIADFGEAIALYKDDTNRAEAHYNRGRVYDYMGEYAHAANDYSATINLMTGGTTLGLAYANRGTIYDKQNNFSAAVADYTEAIRYLTSSRHKAITYYNRGNTHRKTGNFLNGLEDLNRAIMLYPVNRGITIDQPPPWISEERIATTKYPINNLAFLDPWQAAERLNVGGGKLMVTRCIALVYYFKALLAYSSNDRLETCRHVERALNHDWHIRIVARKDRRFAPLKDDFYWKSLMA